MYNLRTLESLTSLPSSLSVAFSETLQTVYRFERIANRKYLARKDSRYDIVWFSFRVWSFLTDCSTPCTNGTILMHICQGSPRLSVVRINERQTWRLDSRH